MNLRIYPSEYTATDARLYYRLRQFTDGYNNNRNFNTVQGKKDRQSFLD